jgi:hypothetical protein
MWHRRSRSFADRGATRIARDRSCIGGGAAIPEFLAIGIGIGLGLLSTDEASADWLPEVPLTSAGIETDIGLNHTPLAYDAAGGLIVAWAQRDTPQQNFQIYARRRAWAVFDPPALIVPYPDPQPGSLLGAKFPSLAPVGDSLFVSWHDYRHGGIFNSEIYGRSLALDGGLGTQLRLTTTSNGENPGDNGYVPTAIPAGTDLHVVWYDYRWDPNRADVFAKRRLPSGAWITALGDSADVNVSRGVVAGYSAGAPAIAGAADGSLHLAWVETQSGEYRLRYARFVPLSGWVTPVTVHTQSALLEAPTAALDPVGTLHVVWVDGRAGGNALWVRSRPAGGSFGSELALTSPAADAGDPCLISTADGALHLVWQDARVDLLNREIFYRRRAPGMPWDVSSATDIRLTTANGRSDRPSMTADRSTPANLAVAWRDRRSGVSEIYLREFRPGGPIGVPDVPGSVDGAGSAASSWFVLGPNPGSGGVTFRAAASEPIAVRDVKGRLLRRLAPGAQLWDGRDASGRLLPAGVYFLAGTITSRTDRVVRLR